MAGIQGPDLYRYAGGTSWPNNNLLNPSAQPFSPLTRQYNLYNTAVEQQAGDYGNIMKQYQDLARQSSGSPIQQISPQTYVPQQMRAPENITPKTYTPASYSAQSYTYKPSADVTASLGNLKGLSETGGYSPQDIADLRARGVSPIRAVYANAQRGVDRQRALSGGYSPNYNAVSAKMARELSDQIADAIQNVNAGIAQNVAGNKLSAAPQYASAAAGQSGLENQIGMGNTAAQNQARMLNAGAINEAGQFNTGANNNAQLQNIANQLLVSQFNTGSTNQANQFNLEQPYKAGQFNLAARGQGQDQLLRAIQGQQSLYGTTPAMSALFGGQALSGAELQNMINQQGNQGNSQFFNSFMGGLGRA